PPPARRAPPAGRGRGAGPGAPGHGAPRRCAPEGTGPGRHERLPDRLGVDLRRCPAARLPAELMGHAWMRPGRWARRGAARHGVRWRALAALAASLATCSSVGVAGAQDEAEEPVDVDPGWDDVPASAPRAYGP